MPMTYSRSLAVVAIIAASGLFAASGFMQSTWHALLPVFEWMETTPFGVIGKTWGAAFAVVEAFHLLGLALLGGSVLVGDSRLLGLCFTDVPCREVQDQAHAVFLAGLALLLATGIFMACGVAIKIYYLPVFWYKMLALAAGVAFVYGIRRPLLKADPAHISAGTLRAVAAASLMVWFTVAATGRWIGFSG